MVTDTSNITVTSTSSRSRRGSAISIRRGSASSLIIIPNEYYCPITLLLMEDPVVASDGYSYDKAAIVKWFQKGHLTSPTTGNTLEHTYLTPNIALKNLIEEFKEKLSYKEDVRPNLEEAVKLREEMLEIDLQSKDQSMEERKTDKIIQPQTRDSYPELLNFVEDIQGELVKQNIIIQELKQKISKLELDQQDTQSQLKLVNLLPISSIHSILSNEIATLNV